MHVVSDTLRRVSGSASEVGAQLRWLLRLWFGFREPVDQRTYFLSGVALMVLKYGVDASVILAVTGELWTPLTYLSPMLGARAASIPAEQRWLLMLLLVWSIPFMWIGVSMSMRRAADAGFSPWIGLSFLVVTANYLVMLLLCILPSVPPEKVKPSGVKITADTDVLSMLFSAAAGAAAGVAMVSVSIFSLRTYAAALFLGVPFCMGLVTTYLYNRGQPRSEGASLVAAQVSLLMAGGGLLLFALEGAVCILMAYPIAATIAVLGAIVGRMLALAGAERDAHATLILLSLPFLMGAEAMHNEAPLREVVSTIEIDAPAGAIWENVVGFSELPPPSELVFRLGIAHPIRARIEGEGVGAIRHCEFSTGPFVEPITRWEPPLRLSFEVVSQPPPMHEWSPYQHVNAPHLIDNMRSKRGEFRLIPLSDGRTRLEGTTWYELEMFPQFYWTMWSDMLVHNIHNRVLQHIKTETETRDRDRT